MPGPKPVGVDVNLIRNMGKVDFDPVSTVRGSNTPSGKHRFVFRNRGHPGFKVRFNIIDPDDFGYVFPNALSEAMWVKTIDPDDDDCPTTSQHWPGFQAVGLENNNRTLVVDNENMNEQRFAFTLRMTRNPGGGPFIEYDPIGDDRNGPRQLNLLSVALPILGVGAVALLAYVGFKLLTGR